ncbi:MAG: OadG family transporter subunit [Alcanivorax sp.]|jgi:oxaloacetate decarboxylase gamma subunit|nr:oxaloacetate decarboxylase [Alcanivorax sp.]HIK76057.1 oxaloacetate decarboxylase [Alcanivorax sp.]|tara:strand:- start:419 stop:670 length:252 start_codon:yes stop_codon:yes gene_type:complete
MNDLLAQGVQLMVLGMGVVIAFLLILVAVMTGLSALVQRFAPESTGGQPAAAPAPAGASPAPQLSRQRKAAIQAAIRQHRAQR